MQSWKSIAHYPSKPRLWKSVNMESQLKPICSKMFCTIFTQSFDAFWCNSIILKINCKAVSTTASNKGMHLPTHLIGQIDRSSLNFHLLPEYDRVKNSTVTNFDWSIKEASIMKNQRATQILVEASHSTVMICGELKQWVPMNYFLEDFWPPLQVMGCLNQLHHSSESHHKEQFMWETGFSTGSAQTQAPLCM